MVIISVINQKGGVGKTTISTNLAYGLAEAGRKVLLIDLDPQANTSAIYCDEEILSDIPTVQELFSQKSTVGIKSLIRPAEVVGEKVDNLSIIPSNIHLAPEADLATTRIHKEKILLKHLKTVEHEFDYVLIDSPPSYGVLTINSIYVANLVIIPVSIGNRYGLDGIADLFELIESVKEGEPYDYRVVKNELDLRNKRSIEYTNSQLEGLKENIMETAISKAEAIRHSQAESKPIYAFEPKATRSVQDFNNLTNEIISFEGISYVKE